MTVEFKNVKVVFSNMRNKLNKDLFSREFSIEVDVNSPEFKQLQENFKEINEKAKTYYGKQLGKKVKPASTEKGAGSYLFGERDEEYGDKARLKFVVYNTREKEVTLDDGSTKKELYEVLSPIYNGNAEFCYKLDNNGKKQYKTENGTPWTPLSQNVIDVKCSLVASYNKSDNRVSIRLKADEVKIVESNVSGKKGGLGFVTLDDNTQNFVKEVEYTKPIEEESDTFTEDDLASLDV